MADLWDFIHLLKRHKNIKTTLFYNNDYTNGFDHNQMIQYMEDNDIDYYKDN